jgi:hypothetical protein
MKHLKPVINPRKVKELVACIGVDVGCGSIDVEPPCTVFDHQCVSGDTCGDCQATDYCPNGDVSEPECGCDTCFAGDETTCTFDGC